VMGKSTQYSTLWLGRATHAGLAAGMTVSWYELTVCMLQRHTLQ
jgi:hypothetical protein